MNHPDPPHGGGAGGNNNAAAPSAPPPAAAASLFESAPIVQDIFPHNGFHVIVPKETPAQQLIANIQKLDWAALKRKRQVFFDTLDDPDADGEVPGLLPASAVGDAKADGDDEEDEESGSSSSDDDESSSDEDDDDMSTVKPPGAAAKESTPPAPMSSMTSEEIAMLHGQVSMQLDQATHELGIMRQLVYMLVENPPPPPDFPADVEYDPVFFKTIHPVPLPKPPLPVTRQLNDLALVAARKRRALSTAAAALRKGAQDLQQGVHSEDHFFANHAVALRNRNWMLHVRPVHLGGAASGGGGMYVDYALSEYPTPFAKAEILRVLPGQFTPFDSNIEVVEISPSLRLAFGLGGGPTRRIRATYAPRKTTSAAAGDAEAKATVAPAVAPLARPHRVRTALEHPLDARLRRAQENYLAQARFAEICSSVAAAGGPAAATLRDERVIIPLGHHGELHVSLEEEDEDEVDDNERDAGGKAKGGKRKRRRDAAGTPPPPTRAPQSVDVAAAGPLAVEELLLNQGVALGRFVDWVQFRVFARDVLAQVHQIVQSVRYCLPDPDAVRMHIELASTSPRPTPETPDAEDSEDPDGLLVRVTLGTRAPPFEMALQPPSTVTVRVPQSGRHVVVAADPRQLRQLVQHHVADEVVAHVRALAATVLEPAAADALKVDVAWTPALAVRVGQAATAAGGFAGGWAERLLVEAGIV
ncbi:hypothetical protein H9P43_004870 [Blastocladiella emersonii ATCC 22665]|nr:hypothetical protein H9P43_004870 [Blastocladiella emersonii ATCC 22665]